MFAFTQNLAIDSCLPSPTCLSFFSAYLSPPHNILFPHLPPFHPPPLTPCPTQIPFPPLPPSPSLSPCPCPKPPLPCPSFLASCSFPAHAPPLAPSFLAFLFSFLFSSSSYIMICHSRKVIGPAPQLLHFMICHSRKCHRPGTSSWLLHFRMCHSRKCPRPCTSSCYNSLKPI